MKRTLINAGDKIKGLRKNLYLRLNRFRLSFRITKINGKLRIYIHEKHRRKVRRIKWIFALVGLFISLITLPPLYSFMLAFALFILGLIVEKIFYYYTSLFVHLVPDFEIINDLWVGMSFGYYEPPDKKLQIPLVGLVFADREYAQKFFMLLKKWNYNSLEDRNNNFVVSIIINKNKEEYFTYIYPNITREGAKKFVSDVESKRKKTYQDEMHVALFAFVFTMKRFVILPKSYFPIFRERYNDGVPYRLEAFIGSEEKADKCEIIQGFTKFNLKIKNREDLSREDIEFDLLRIYGD
jgi:hypothetical protein